MFATTIRSSAPTCSAIMPITTPPFFIGRYISEKEGGWVVRLAQRLAGLPVIHPVIKAIVDVAVRTVVIDVFFYAAGRCD